MTLRYLAIMPKLAKEEEYINYTASDWIYNTCFIANYLSKAVRKLKIETQCFNMLSVSIEQNPMQEIDLSECFLSLTANVPFSQDQMDKLVGITDYNTRAEQYLMLLEQGYEIANKYYDIQIDKLLNLHQEFRNIGYKNEWLFKKKIIKAYGIYVFFKCYFTAFEFRLELEVYDQKQTHLITKGVVYRTGPDEIFFSKDFNKGIEIEGNMMYLLNFLDKRAFGFNLDLLSDGEFNLVYLDKYLIEWQPKHIKIIQRVTWSK